MKISLPFTPGGENGCFICDKLISGCQCVGITEICFFPFCSRDTPRFVQIDEKICRKEEGVLTPTIQLLS